MSEKIWECKIGGTGGELPGGADNPMRDAIADAFREVTGVEAQFIFSGWGAELTECERAAHENREPSPEHYAQLKLQQAAPELLEACETMAEWFRREHEGFPNAGEVRTTAQGEAAWRKWWEENLRLCDLAKNQANAAIDKATK